MSSCENERTAWRCAVSPMISCRIDDVEIVQEILNMWPGEPPSSVVLRRQRDGRIKITAGKDDVFFCAVTIPRPPLVTAGEFGELADAASYLSSVLAKPGELHTPFRGGDSENFFDETVPASEGIRW